MKADFETLDTDILVLGGGLAGCFASIKARRAGASRVILLDKAVPGKSGCSTFAAGVIGVFFPHRDQLDRWMAELVELGEQINDQQWLQTVLESTSGLIEEMASWGADFVRTADGAYERILGRGGRPGGALRNIMFRGHRLMDPVVGQIRRLGIPVLTRTPAIDLLVNRGRVVGALGLDVSTGRVKVVTARATILAAGSTYSKGTFIGHKMMSGDSHAVCFRAGAELMSFDHTSRNLSSTEVDLEGMNMFQGLGGRFVNGEGEEFLDEYDPILGNRTTKARMCAAFSLEVDAGRGPIFLDMTHFGAGEIAKIREAVPLATTILEQTGVLVDDRILRRLPWGPAGVGSIGDGGGARINRRCQSTNLEGLYVVGDAAARLAAGSHGIGSGNLSWAMVTGAMAGEFAAADVATLGPPDVDWRWVRERAGEAVAPLGRQAGVDPEHVLLAVQDTIFPYRVFEIRHATRLEAALRRVKEIQRDLVPHMTATTPRALLSAFEARSLAICAELYLRFGLERRESRCNLREDYRLRDNIDWLKWICARPEGEILRFWTEDVPRGPVAISRDRLPHPFWVVAERRSARASAEVPGGHQRH